MRVRLHAVSLALFALALPAAAQTRTLVLTDSSRLWFEADATMGRFRGDATVMTGTAAVGGDVDSATGAVTVRVAGFRTGIGMRDRHLRDDMDAASFPDIVFELQRVEPQPSGAVVFHGTLRIRAVERVVAIPGRLDAEANGYRVRGGLPVLFTEFGMRPPRRMAGLARVADRVDIGFDLRFAPAP